MNNFSTLGAIVGALEHTAIARMHKTMDAVPKDVTKVSFAQKVVFML